MSYRIARIYRLSRKVLAVGVSDGSWWSAYVDAVPGYNHEEEAPQVLEEGTKVSYEIAKILFPDLDEAYVWRD